MLLPRNPPWRPLLAALALGCGAPAAPAATPTRDPGAAATDPAYPALEVRARNTPGRLRLALFVDVGARDLGPAATLLAWAMAERAGAGAAGVAHPDALEVALPADPRTLDETVARLARALSLRAIDAEGHARRMRRLDRAARAAAGNGGRDAVRLALAAAIGPEAAAGFLPLPAPGAPAPSREELEAMAAAHLGPSRALIAAAGDVPAAALRQAVARAFRVAPGASEPRAPRRLPPRAVAPALPYLARAGGDDDGAHVAVVFGAGSVAAARGAAFAAAARVGGRVRSFPVRGGGLAVVEAAPGAATAQSADLALAGERWRAEGWPAPSPAPVPEAPTTTVRWLGLAWAAGEPSGADEPAWWGVGIRAPAAGDAALAAAIAAALPAPAPTPPAADGVRGALEATLPNGAALTVARRPGPRAAIAVLHRDGGGPGHEVGLRALLAETAARECAGLSAGALAARAEALDGTLAPVLRPDALGLVVGVPVARWREGLALALDCAGAPRITARGVAAARTRLSGQDRDRRMRAWVADLVAPAAPGLVAPKARPEAVATVPWRRVARRADALRRGVDATVAVVGDLPAEEAFARAARRLGRWPSGGDASPGATASPAPPAPARSFPWAGSTPRIVAAWVHRGATPPATATRIGAEALGAVLAARARRLARATPVWHGGGVLPDGAWVAVAFDAPDPEALLEALDGWRPSVPDGALDARIEAGLRAHGEAGARATVTAVREALRAGGGGDPGGPPGAAEARAAARQLLAGALAVGLPRSR